MTAPISTHEHHDPTDGPAAWAMALAMLAHPRPRAELAADLAAVGSGDHLVDVGCGPGTAVRVALRRGATATGVDPSGPARRLGRWLTRDRRATFLAGTAEALPVDDGGATVAWALASAHHWSDPAAAARELARVLGPGGRLVVVERAATTTAHGHAAHGLVPDGADALAGHLTAAGLTRTEVRQVRLGRHELVTITAVSPE